MGKKSEPVITKCSKNESWTKVTFKPDLNKFNMAELENDVVALMSKRVVDIAGCVRKVMHSGRKLKVELNGQPILVNSEFSDYADLYLTSANRTRKDPLPRFVLFLLLLTFYNCLLEWVLIF